MSGFSRSRAGVALQIDWARCRGHGHCAGLLPEVIQLDPWGYPILGKAAGDAPVPADSTEAAERAVSWCPNLALRLVPAERSR